MRYLYVVSIISKLVNGEEMNLSDYEQIWDYIHAKSVAKAFYLIGKKGVDGKAHPVGSGIGRPLKECVQTVYDIAGNHDAKLNFGVVPNSMNSVNFL